MKMHDASCRRAIAFWISLLCLAGVHPRAADADTPLSVYGQLPSLEDWALSPDGTKAANVQTKGDERYILIRTLPGAQLLGGSRIGDGKLRSIKWMDNDNLLIEISITSDTPVGYVGPRQEWYQLLTYNIPKRKLAGLSVGESALNVTGMPMVREINGVTTLFVSGFVLLPGRVGAGLFKYTATGALMQVIPTGVNNASNGLVDAAGRVTGVLTYKSDDKKWELYVPEKDRMRVATSGNAALDLPVLLGFSITGDAIIVQLIENANSVWKSLLLKDGSWGEPMESFGEPILERKSGRVIGAVGRAGCVFFDNELKARWNAVLSAFPKERVDLISNSDDFGKILVRAFGPDDGYIYALFDWSGHHTYILGNVYDRLVAVAEVKAISYSAGDGLTIPAYLTLPRGKAAANLPLIVLPHGGPVAADTARFDWWAQALAAQGYAVLQPNYRGSDLGYRFVAAGFGEFGRKMQTDVSDGVGYLAKQGIIDPRRVCIVGASYGGYAALAGITMQPEVYRCAVSVAGLSDLKRMLQWTNLQSTSFSERHGDSVRQRYWDRFMDVTGPNDPALSAISPIEHVSAVQGRVLLIHGKDDTVVPYDQSDAMASALKRAGKSVEFVTLKKEDHWLSRSATRLQMLEATVAFLRTSNPPD
jgi:dipeptidyl aminopeptidase/acylaminoacyl peptidase